jgi:outer membrane protein assembly factor BamB
MSAKLPLLFVALGTALGAFAQPQPGTLLWTYRAAVRVASAPALGPDGTVYVLAQGLVAITNSGSLASNKWTFPVGGSPVIGSDGTIYVAESRGLFAINPDGSQKWLYPIAGGSGGSPAIGFDNTIYVQGMTYPGFYAISPSGTLKWRAGVGESMFVVSPVVGMDGTIYFTSCDLSELFAFNPDGHQKWVVNPRDLACDLPAIGADGTVYCDAAALTAIGRDGSILWSTDVNGWRAIGQPVIGRDGTIYVSSSYGDTLQAIKPGGQLAWRALSGLTYREATTAATIDTAGTVYYCTSNSLWALSPEGHVQWSFASSVSAQYEFAETSPIIGYDGTIYAAIGSNVFAFAGTNGPADSPWPMYQQNPRHTGKVEKPSLQNPQIASNANFQFQLFGQISNTFSIEVCTNLATWTSLTNFVATKVPMEVVGPAAINSSVKFFRAVEQGPQLKPRIANQR